MTALHEAHGGGWVPAYEHWDVEWSLKLAARIRAFDRDLAKPGWCWNSAITLTLLLGPSEAEVMYVEGWLHNESPFAPYPKYPHAWTVLGDGTILDTTSGAVAGQAESAKALSRFIYYEPVNEWDWEHLFGVLEEDDPTPPLTPEFVGWTP
jgi:hypothetical protein